MALRGPSRSATSEPEHLKMQTEHLPDLDPGSNDVGSKSLAGKNPAEIKAVLYSWAVMLAVLSVIYGIGYCFSP